MDIHPNAALIHRAWQAVAEGDVDDLRRIIAEKARWTATGGNPWAGRHEGFEAIVDMLARVGEEMDAFDANIVDTLVSEGRVLVIYHVSAAIHERVLECNYLMLADIEHATIANIWSCPMDPEALLEFWADMPQLGGFSVQPH
jgi:ketosteroid isomerase-like protein